MSRSATRNRTTNETSIEVEIEPTSPRNRPAVAVTAHAGGSSDTADSSADGLAARVATMIEKRFLFRAQVREVPCGSLPRFELKGKRFIKEVSEAECGPGA